MSYFGQWYKQTCEKLQQSGEIKKLEAEFNKQKTDLGRVSILQKQKDVGGKISECFVAKSNKKSEEFRNVGNKQYLRKEFDEAISSYSNSTAYATENSKELPLAYANRSAVLYVLNEFQLSANDINIAFKKGYPCNLHYKLYERLGKCYLELGSIEKASNAFKNALSSLTKSSLEVAKRNEIAHALFELSSQCEGSVDFQNDEVTNNRVYNVRPPRIPKDDVNEIYPCASQAFTIIESANEGRHAIAVRDIPVGEVIIVEKPFTSICLPSCLETHCYNCLSRFKVCFACRSCASVRFCSGECEKKSWESFHSYECKYFLLLTHEDIGLGHLALKMIVQEGLSGLKQFETRKKLINDCCKGGTNEHGIYEPSDYYCVYSLIGNSDLRHMSDLFRRSLMAIYICNILCKTGFLKTDDNDYCITASHLLKQIQMLPCNAHEVSELKLECDEVANSELKEIGSAAYTTLSLLNHSCDPSIVRHCYGDVCVLRAIKYIKEGEAIVDNYGHLYPVEEKIDRQNNLMGQYYFDCKCIACQEDWPLYNDIQQENPTFLCNSCGNGLSAGAKQCDKCSCVDSDIATFNKLQSNYQRCMEEVLDTGKYTQHLPTLLQFLNLLSSKARLPVIHLNNCQEVVKLCFGLQGNFVKL